MNRPLCIYHGNCADGFGAAWAVHECCGDSFEYMSGVYGEIPPDVTGRDVLMVDFSYKKDVLEHMIEQASSVLIIDHHKSAQEDLSWLPQAQSSWHLHLKWARQAIYEQTGKAAAVFDLNHSGAALTWSYFHKDQPLPTLLAHVQDRDLWRFNLPGTREIQACVFSHPYDFEVWGRLCEDCESIKGRRELVLQGTAIERKHFKDINELLPQTTRRMVIGGCSVPVANLPYTMSSDAAGILAEYEPFAACYFDKADKRVFSLRSRKDGGADVSAIAKQYGGGGHRNAAGFQTPLGWEGDR